MTLNKKQKGILVISLFFIVIFFLFPAWEGVTGSGKQYQHGHHFLFSPPKHYTGAQLDYGRMIISIGITLILTSGLMLLTKK